jgi:CubicO group peptidase (beta-lactamase class C family)
METSEIVDALRAPIESGHLLGVAATAWSASGLDFAGGFGYAAEGVPMAPDTVIWIASMTKAVAAAAVMQQVERGRLTLDTPVSDHLEYFADVQVLEGVVDGASILRPPRGEVTVRHLLTHTSGLGYDWLHPELGQWRQSQVEGRLGTMALLEQPLVCDPGTEWHYGVGLDWAGRLVEVLTGERLDEYLRHEIFDPLGMSDTTFRHSAAPADRAAVVHVREGDGFRPSPVQLDEDPEIHSGGGGLYSTVLDYRRFARMIAQDGELDGARVLDPSTVAAMADNHIGDLQVHGFGSLVSAMNHDVVLLADQRTGWGLSFLRNTETTSEGRSPGSLFWAGLANTYYWIDRRKGVVGIFATQLLPFFDPVATETLANFEAAVYRAVS